MPHIIASILVCILFIAALYFVGKIAYALGRRLLGKQNTQTISPNKSGHDPRKSD